MRHYYFAHFVDQDISTCDFNIISSMSGEKVHHASAKEISDF